MTKIELTPILEDHRLWLDGDPAGKRANLSGMDISGALLSGADLRGALLSETDLSGADLRGANLSEAVLRDAILSGANLRGAILRGALLRGAILDGVEYDEGTAFFALVCPEDGAFIGFKRCGGYIVKLRITENAKRSSATTRKCRCSEAEVLSITHPNGAPADVSFVSSNWDIGFIYGVGETVRVDDFCEDRWRECAPGIHFFLTREEAVQYR